MIAMIASRDFHQEENGRLMGWSNPGVSLGKVTREGLSMDNQGQVLEGRGGGSLGRMSQVEPTAWATGDNVGHERKMGGCLVE